MIPSVLHPFAHSHACLGKSRASQPKNSEASLHSCVSTFDQLMEGLIDGCDSMLGRIPHFAVLEMKDPVDLLLPFGNPQVVA